MKRRSGILSAGVDMIEAFKVQWPGHGFPDELVCIVTHFDARGDLVDLECFDEDGNPLNPHEFDGAALVAIVADVQDHGYTVRPDGIEMVEAIRRGKDW